MQAIAGIETIQWLMPELVLLLAAVYLYVMGMTLGSRAWWCSFTLGALAIAWVTLWRQESSFWGPLLSGGDAWYRGPLWIDVLGELTRNLAILIGGLIALLGYRAAPAKLAPEFLGTLLLAVVGLMVVGRANNLVLLFLGLELISIPTYVLLFLSRSGRSAMESTAKYFYLSLLASALLLYGFSFLYGLAGTTTLGVSGGGEGITWAIGNSSSLLLPIAIVLVLAGTGFKMAAVPFHFYAPDVYQGTSSASAGFLATIPKLAGVVLLARLFGQPGVQSSPFSWQLVVLLAIVTMTLGNTCALWQRDLRRLMAYSSIAHTGYMLMGLAVLLAMGSSDSYGGVAGMVFYVAVYIPATLGVFAVLTVLSKQSGDVSSLSDLQGIARRHPVVTALLAVFLFSLAGIPPLAGFWGKLGLFSSVLEGGMRWALGTDIDPRGGWMFALALAGAINAAVSAAYYLRVIGVMYFERAGDRVESKPLEREPLPLGPMVAVLGCAWLVVLLGVMPGALMQTADQAEKMLRPVVEDSSPLPGEAAADQTAPSERLANGR